MMFAWPFRRRANTSRDAAVLEVLGGSELFGGDILKHPELRSLSCEKLARVLNSMVDRGVLTCRDKTLHACGRVFRNIRCWKASKHDD